MTRLQVGFAVADGGDALLGFIRALRAPGAMIVPIEATRDGAISQQLTLIQKAGRTMLPLAMFRESSTHTPQASDGQQSRVAVAETLFSKGKFGTCRDLPPKVELFDVAQAAIEVIAIEESIKRYFLHACTHSPAHTCDI